MKKIACTIGLFLIMAWTPVQDDLLAIPSKHNVGSGIVTKLSELANSVDTLLKHEKEYTSTPITE